MARQVTIATVARSVAAGVARSAYVDECEHHVCEAAARAADIVCIPEGFDWLACAELAAAEDQGAYLRSVAEPMPGPLTDRFAALARAHRMNVALTTSEADGGEVYVTSIVLDREGRISGKYRKAHVTVLEHLCWGLAPGDSLPVFALDFGKVAFVICNDINFPEQCGVLALNGAEILFWPTQANGPSEQIQQRMLQGRAIDYHVYMVSSTFASGDRYDPGAGRPYQGRACIIDPDGTVIADTGHGPGLAVATIDLDRPRNWPGHVGLFDLRFGDAEDPRLFRLMRRPELYGRLSQPVRNIYNAPDLVDVLGPGEARVSPEALDDEPADA